MLKRIKVYLKVNGVSSANPTIIYETDYWWEKEILNELNDLRTGDYIEFKGSIFKKNDIDKIIVEEIPEQDKSAEAKDKQENNKMPF